MLSFRQEDAAMNPIGAVAECTNLLSLCYAGLHMNIFAEKELEDAGLDTVAMQMGAASISAYCSNVLSYLVGMDLIEEASSE